MGQKQRGKAARGKRLTRIFSPPLSDSASSSELVRSRILGLILGPFSHSITLVDSAAAASEMPNEAADADTEEVDDEIWTEKSLYNHLELHFHPLNEINKEDICFVP